MVLTRESFSDNEWALLVRTSSAVALAASFAEGDSMIGRMNELKAGLAAGVEAAKAFPDNQAIAALAQAMQSVDKSEAREEAAEADAEAGAVQGERRGETSAATSIDLATQSMAIMQERGDLTEAVEFKYWLFTIAEQVALASKSGGVLGFGGTALSESENAYLDQLAAAIGYDRAANS